MGKTTKQKKEDVKKDRIILFPLILILFLFYLIAITSARTYQTIGSDFNTTSAFFNNVTGTDKLINNLFLEFS